VSSYIVLNFLIKLSFYLLDRSGQSETRQCGQILRRGTSEQSLEFDQQRQNVEQRANAVSRRIIGVDIDVGVVDDQRLLERVENFERQRAR